MTIGVVVAGLGRIGCGYDLARAGGDRPASHMGALFADPRFSVVAAVDPDEERRRVCREKWPDTEYAADAASTIRRLKPEVLCLATPASVRTELIDVAAKSDVRIVFCEKPLASTMAEAERIATIVRDAGLELILNFSRRWEPGCREAARVLKSGEIGDITLIRCLYTRGISNNGSHLIDLLRWWFGDIRMPALGQVRDPDTADFDLICGKGIPVEVRAMSGDAYDLFRVEAFGTEGTLLLDDFGEHLSVRGAEHLDADPALRVLGPPQLLQTDPLSSMAAAWNNVHDCLSGDASPGCGIDDGLAVARVCDSLETAMSQ